MRPLFVIDLNEDISLDLAHSVMVPNKNEEIIFIQTAQEAKLENLAVRAGVFSNKAQAKNAGISGNAPFGLELIGLAGATFWVWNPQRQQCTLSKKKIFTDIFFRLRETLPFI